MRGLIANFDVFLTTARTLSQAPRFQLPASGLIRTAPQSRSDSVTATVPLFVNTAFASLNVPRFLSLPFAIGTITPFSGTATIYAGFTGGVSPPGPLASTSVKVKLRSFELFPPRNSFTCLIFAGSSLGPGLNPN